jgi:hypothetical protein
MNRLISLPLAALVVGASLGLGTALPAFAADIPTKIAFVGATEVSAPFNSPWELPIRVTSESENGKFNIKGTDGTVDIFVEGVPGEYVTAATIYPGGMTYFAQPANEPPLAAGEYTVTAVFTPAAGSTFGTSKTAKSATLTITPLTMTTSVELLTDPAVVAVPTVRTSLAGEYLDVVGAPPSGTWTVTGVDADGDDAFTVTAEQPTEATEGTVGPLDIPITDPLEPGETYTITTEFDADPLIASGLEFENAAPLTHTTTPLTFAETLSTPVAVPIWATILNCVLVIGLVALLVWLLSRLTRGRADDGDDAAPATGPSALPAAPSPAALDAASEAPVAPTSTSWSLADDADETNQR